jgi:hypothetical protein
VSPTLVGVTFSVGFTLRKINEAFARVPEEPFRRDDFSSLLRAEVFNALNRRISRCRF